MTTQAKFVRGSVRMLRCDKCGTNFPLFDYEVDSDTEVIGLYSAGTCGGDSLLLIDLSIEEWHAVQTGSLHKLPSRFSRVINRDYRLTHILRVEQPTVPAAGSSFAEFRQHYHTPTVVYSCPCCEKGEAVTQSEMVPSEYISSGRNIVAMEPLVLIF